jgi:hypothetical protein
MGQLTPGATYIYEKADGITYAREMGAPASERFEIGRDFTVDKMFGVPVREIAKIVDLIHTAKNNPALQEALDRAIIIYELSRQDEPIQHHPV